MGGNHNWFDPEVNAARRAVLMAVGASLVDRIERLEAEVVVLMRNGANVKAQGPAHTAAYLRCYARELLGPRWADSRQRGERP